MFRLHIKFYPPVSIEKPFTDQNDQGIDGVFDLEKKQKVLSIIEQINYNAIA